MPNPRSPDMLVSDFEGKPQFCLPVDESPASIDNPKGLYLQSVRLNSTENVQRNWSRIILREVKQSEECVLGWRTHWYGSSRWQAFLKWHLLGLAVSHSHEFCHDPSRSAQRTEESFIRRAQRLAAHGHTDAALDLIYDSVDDLMRNREFDRLSSLLESISIADSSTDLLLGILTATLPARGKLPARSTLFNDVARVLKLRGDYEDGLLAGLED